MIEITFGGAFSYIWGGIADRGPFFISIAVAIIAWLQWRTSKEVAAVGMLQHETNRMAVEIAWNKRQDELFDRRLRVFDAIAELTSHVETHRELDRETFHKFTNGGAVEARFLFDEEFSDDWLVLWEMVIQLFEDFRDDIDQSEGIEKCLEFVETKEILERICAFLETFETDINLSGDTDETPQASSSKPSLLEGVSG